MDKHTERQMPPNDVQQLREALEEGFARMSKQLAEIATSQDRTINVVFGNPLDRDDRGLVGEVKNIRERVSLLEIFKTRSLGISVGVIGVATVVWAIVNFLFK